MGIFDIGIKLYCDKCKGDNLAIKRHEIFDQKPDNLGRRVIYENGEFSEDKMMHTNPSKKSDGLRTIFICACGQKMCFETIQQNGSLIFKMFLI